MPIRVRLNVMLAERNVKSKELAEYVGITEANLSLLKQGKVKGALLLFYDNKYSQVNIS